MKKTFMRASAALKMLLMGEAALMAFATPAHAQEAPAAPAHAATSATPSAQVEEIIVTARHQAENVQSVPVAITALSARTLEERDVRSLVDVARYAPGLTFDRGSNVNGGSISAAVYMRGVGQRLAQPTADPAVGLYVDGIYLGRVVGSVLSVVDAERVEVLRGPQGTLYGRNTLGGAINIASQLPTGDLDGYVDVGGGDYSERNLRAAAEFPLVQDQLAARVSISSMQHDGYDHNVLTGQDMGSLDSAAGRVVLRWTPKNNFRANFFYDTTSEHDTPQAVQPTVIRSTSALNPIYADGTRNAFGTASLVNKNSNDLDAWGTAASLEWDLAPNTTLTSITGYRWMKTHVAVDGDGTPLSYNENEIYDTQDQTSQEVRLNGRAWNDRLTWQMGAYYAQESVADLNFIRRRLVASIPATFVTIRQQIDGTNTNWALFTQESFKLLDTLSLTAGVRYSHEKKEEVVGSQTAPAFPPVGSGFPPTPLSGSWDSTSPRISLDYSPTNNLLAYVSYAEGFKSGGFTYVTVFQNDLSLYDPERTATWEAGLKSEFFDHRLRINGAAFTTRYQNLQFESFFAAGVLCPTFCARTLNAAAARIQGVELELTAAPAAGLDLFANVAYMHNEITKVDSRALNLVNLHSTLPRTPDWTASVGGSYTFGVGSAGNVTLRADYSYRSLVYFDFANVAGAAQDDFGLLNAGITFDTGDNRWQFAINGQNLTDELYASTGTGSTLASDGYSFVMYGAPRTVTASVRFRFSADH